MTIDREWILTELRKSLQVLSLDGRAALDTEPSGSCKADELALDYDNILSAALGNIRDEFTSEQQSALLLVNESLSKMSSSKHHDPWTEEAVISDPEWRKVRSQARGALELLKWED